MVRRAVAGVALVLAVGWCGAAWGQTALILQDQPPCGCDLWADLLADVGVTTTTLGRGDIATEPLHTYDLVVVAGCQGTPFNAELDNHVWRFEDLVDAGGRLLMMTSTDAAAVPVASLLYGAAQDHDATTYSSYAYNLAPTHPLMSGQPALWYGEYASHGQYTGLPGEALPLTSNDNGEVSSMLVTVGTGGAYSSALTLEQEGCGGGATGLAEDAIDYLLDGFCPDEDLDGHLGGTCNDDCDDADPTVHPGYPELCDGLDNDCDGALAPYEEDLDGDGFMACAECDDEDPDSYPGAPDDCDGVDNDCDGLVDEDCADDDDSADDDDTTADDDDMTDDDTYADDDEDPASGYEDADMAAMGCGCGARQRGAGWTFGVLAALAGVGIRRRQLPQ